MENKKLMKMRYDLRVRCCSRIIYATRLDQEYLDKEEGDIKNKMPILRLFR